MARRRGKVDKNQGVIVERFRALGCSVRSLANVGDGMPDLIVGCMGYNLLVEVKGRKGKLTKDQKDFHGEWRGRIHIVRSVEEATELIMVVRACGIVQRFM